MKKKKAANRDLAADMCQGWNASVGAVVAEGLVGQPNLIVQKWLPALTMKDFYPRVNRAKMPKGLSRLPMKTQGWAIGAAFREIVVVAVVVARE